MGKIQMAWLPALMSSILFVLNAGSVYAANEVSFQDISKRYWGYSDLQWAIENHVATGYPDGKFIPDQTVRQNELLTMLIRAFKPSDFQSNSDESWDHAYFEYAKELGWEVSSDNPFLTRGGAARLIANANGKNFELEEAVQFLLDINLAAGKYAKTVKGFGTQDPLTRMETISLIKRLKDSSDVLMACPDEIEVYQREVNVQLYENKNHHFSLTLPLSWSEDYEVVDWITHEVSELHNYQFIDRSSSSSGILFTLSVWPKVSWETSSENMMKNIPVIKKLGELNGYVYFYHLPTDVQYDPSIEKEVERYNTMFKEVLPILSTFEWLE